MSDAPLRVLVADDHALFRKGLRALLATLPDVEVVGEAADAAGAVEACRALRPDLVLMDLQMPGGGLAATATITGELPDTHVLVLTMFEDDDSVFAAMRAGARGYVVKDTDPADLARALVTVGRGEALFSRGIAVRMAAFFAERPAAAPAFPGLTPSERAVLALMAAGVDNAGIARRLSLAPKTVRNYLSAVFTKLQVADRSQAIVRARDAGLHLPPGAP